VAVKENPKKKEVLKKPVVYNNETKQAQKMALTAKLSLA